MPRSNIHSDGADGERLSLDVHQTAEGPHVQVRRPHRHVTSDLQRNEVPGVLPFHTQGSGESATCVHTVNPEILAVI